MTRHTLPIAACLALACSAAGAQDLTHAAPAQAHPVFITGATVHTVSGDTIDNGLVAFNEGVITMVGRADDIMPRVRLTADTEVIDATGKHLYPGIIAAESQLGLTEMGSVLAMHDFNETGAFTPEVRAAVAVNPDSTLIPVARTNGILLFTALPTGGRIPGRASVMRADGWTSEDMTALDAAALVVNFPNVRPRYQPFGADSPKEQQDRIDKEVRELDDYFDNAEAYAAARAQNPNHPEDLAFEAMLPFLPPSPLGGEGRGEGSSSTLSPSGRGQGEGVPQRPLLIAANDLDQITAAVTWATGRGLRPIILGGRDAALCTDLLLDHDVPVIVEGTHTFPKRADSPYDDAFTLPARLQAAGVRWCLSPSDRNGNERNLPYEAGRAAAFGLDRDAALRSITLSPAEILGVTDRYGSIDKGKSATLFISSGDCMEITSNVELAFIDGKRIDLTNKQTKLRDKYRDKYQQLGIIKNDD